MDAKPQRPLRMLRLRNDENIPPELPIAKTIHQRNKSSPALTTTTAVAASKQAMKRTAFGDVSNTVSSNRPSKDDILLGNKPAAQNFSKAGNLLNERKSAALLRPAQRPLSVQNLKSLLTGHTNNNNNPTVIETGNKFAQLPSQASQASRKVLTKRHTVIFRDNSLEPVKEHDLPALPPIPSVHTYENAEALPDQRIQYPPATGVVPALQSQSSQDKPLGHVEAKATESRPSSQDKVAALEIIARDNLLPPALTNVPVTSDYFHIQGRQLSKAVSIAAIAETAQKIPQPHHGSLATSTATETAYVSDVLPRAYSHNIQPAPRPEPEEYWDEEEDEIYEEEGFVTARSFRSKGDSTTGAATTILFPQMNQRARKEIAAAKDLVESTRTAEEIEDENYDTSMVAEYGNEIFDYMRQLEVKMLPNAHYMDNQHEIQWSTRSVLMDWLVQVHHRFDLLPETLFLCVNYIDRFLSCKVVSLGKLQLVGATAIFIAAKYEEINCPSIQEIVYMVDGGYTVDEILKAERFMLTMLQFELGWPGPMSFLRRISKADDYDLETRTLAKYFLEVTLMDERFIGSPPSFAAAASHCLSRLLLRKGDWTPHHVFYSGYTYAQLRPLLNTLLECCEQPRKHHAAVYNKYCDKRYKRAAAFVEAEVQRGFQLPDVSATKAIIQAPHITYYDSVSFFRS